MRRTIVILVLGVVATGFFLFGLAWMTTLRQRGWSNDQPTFRRQATFFVAVVSSVIAVSVVNRLLNRPRSFRPDLPNGHYDPTLASPSDHPLRDRFRDG